MNYDEMPAGREMDVLIAEKVMGWKWDSRDEVFYDQEGRSRVDIFNRFSSEIEYAWMVVEKIIAMSYTVLVSNGKHSPPRQTWHCIITIIPQQGGYRDGYADTAPLAICRAALKAVEG